MAKTTTTPKSKVPLKPLVLVIEKSWGGDETEETLELDSKAAEAKVRKAKKTEVS